MFKPSPRVVAIDDNLRDLELIVQAVRAVGWPCQELHYDGGFDSRLKLPMEGIRLVFLDIHLTAGGEAGGAAAKAGPLADALSKAVSPGPFAIIFWTGFPDEAERAMSMLADRTRYPELPLPLHWAFLDKNTVLTLPPQEQPDAKGAANRLARAVETELEKIKLLSPLLTWESRIHSAAARTLDGLATMAMPGSSACPEYRSRLVGILMMIAKEVGPEELIRGQNWRAFELGLLPLLEDHLLDDETSPEHEAAWNAINGMTYHYTEDVASLLNSRFLVDTHVKGQSCSSRGVFCRLLLKPGHWTRYFNRTRENVLSEFMNLERGGKKAKKHRDAALQDAIVGVVEVGAACDHANRKNHMPRHVLALMLPEEHLNIVGHDKGKDKDNNPVYGLGNHGGCVEYGPFQYKDRNWRIAVNFRYMRGFTSAEKMLELPILRLRNQIVNEIGFRESHFHARPGIISFR